MPPSTSEDDTPLPPARHSVGSTAWVLVFLDGLLLGCGSLYWLFRGRFFDENVYRALADSAVPELATSTENVASAAVRLGGVLGLCASLLVMAVGLTAFRWGQRWAWYATWALPLYCSLDISTLASYHALTPTAALWDIGVLSLALFALIGGYGWFFARREPTSAPA